MNETCWFATPQNQGNEREHTLFQTRNLGELRDLEKVEQLNPQNDMNSRNQFLSNFNWTDSTLKP